MYLYAATIVPRLSRAPSILRILIQIGRALNACVRGGVSKQRRKKLMRHESGIGYIHLEDYSLILFVSLGYYLFCEFDNGFKVWIVLLVRLRDRSQYLAHVVAQTKPATKREMKTLTFGARGFVLLSANIADDEEMRVVQRGSVGQREFSCRVYPNRLAR